MALRVTGVPGTSRNIVAPAVSKIYVIANGSDAEVVLKTSSSTGLSVPVGEVYLAYYDPTSNDFRLVGRASASANTPNTLVLRDGSGNFSAGQVTANLIGNVTGNLNGNLTAATPTAPTAVVGTNNTQIATTAFVQSTIPTGVIVMWSGSIVSIPSGWFLCNGLNGTPDLRNRFIVGAGTTYSVGGIGGSANAIVVAHTHTGTTNNAGNHRHTLRAYNSNNINGGPTDGFASTNSDTAIPGEFGEPQAYIIQNGRGQVLMGEAGDHNHSFTTNSTGSSGTNANLPPYYALAYIMKS
jgi:hypothetical protein